MSYRMPPHEGNQRHPGLIYARFMFNARKQEASESLMNFYLTYVNYQPGVITTLRHHSSKASCVTD